MSIHADSLHYLPNAWYGSLVCVLTTTAAIFTECHHFYSAINIWQTATSVHDQCFLNFKSGNGDFCIVVLSILECCKWKREVCQCLLYLHTVIYRTEWKHFVEIPLPLSFEQQVLKSSHVSKGKTSILCEDPLGIKKWNESSEVYTEMHYARAQINKNLMIYFSYTCTT